MTGPVVREELAPDTDVPRFILTDWVDQLGLAAGITAAGALADVDFRLPEPDSDLRSEPWERLQRSFAPGFSSVVTGRQVHGREVRRHGPSTGWSVFDGTDGHITGEAGVLLTVTVADCVPVFLYASDSGEIALLHAGWRGTAAGILEEAVGRLASSAADIHELRMHLGPAICGACYEVGPEVHEQLGLPIPAEPTPVDLRAVLRARGEGCGIERISSSPWCVHHDRGFHSYRRDGARSGRLAAFLGKPRFPGLG